MTSTPCGCMVSVEIPGRWVWGTTWFSRWWQLKYVLFSPRSLEKISNLTHIFSDGLKPPTSFLSKLMLLKRPSVVSSQHEGTRYRIEVIGQIPPPKAGWFVPHVMLVCVSKSGPHYSPCIQGWFDQHTLNTDPSIRVYFWCLLIDPSNNKPLNILQKRMRMGKRAMMILVKLARDATRPISPKKGGKSPYFREIQVKMKYCNFWISLTSWTPWLGLLGQWLTFKLLGMTYFVGE